jgi:hypothetical protein
VLLPWTCVLQLELVHLYQTSSLLPSHLLILASTSLRLLYLLLYSEHINCSVLVPFNVLSIQQSVLYSKSCSDFPSATE